jgi:hypothetical protein
MDRRQFLAVGRLVATTPVFDQKEAAMLVPIGTLAPTWPSENSVAMTDVCGCRRRATSTTTAATVPRH